MEALNLEILLAFNLSLVPKRSWRIRNNVFNEFLKPLILYLVVTQSLFIAWSRICEEKPSGVLIIFYLASITHDLFLDNRIKSCFIRIISLLRTSVLAIKWMQCYLLELYILSRENTAYLLLSVTSVWEDNRDTRYTGKLILIGSPCLRESLSCRELWGPEYQRQYFNFVILSQHFIHSFLTFKFKLFLYLVV